MAGQGQGLIQPDVESPCGGAAIIPAAAEFGSLSLMPEVLLPKLCSFLWSRDVESLRSSCAAMHRSPSFYSPWLNLRRPHGMAEVLEGTEEWQRCAAAMFMLARRVASAVKDLCVEDVELIGPFFLAVRDAGQPLRCLTSLHLRLLRYGGGGKQLASVTEHDEQLLAEALVAGQLPMLQELQLYAASTDVGLSPVWQALGEGLCPKLETVKMHRCSQQLVEGLAAAVVAGKAAGGLLQLKTVSIAPFYFGRSDTYYMD